MNKIIRKLLYLSFLVSLSYGASLDSGEKVFRAYCWGCHHETSVAFGPSFSQIASKRTKGEIQGYIVAPKSMFEQFGHKRTVMPSFGDTLTQDEINKITKFILSFKGK